MSERIVIITPTRRLDRPMFLKKLNQMISRQTVKPTAWTVVGHVSENNKIDLARRIHQGVETALNYNPTIIAIMGDDDWYSPRYLEMVEQTMKNSDVFGIEETIYYHIKKREWKRVVHPYRSSLFCCAFRPSALRNIEWPEDNAIFLDISLYNQFRKNKVKMALRRYYEGFAIGIEHEIGKRTSTGHKVMDFENEDHDWVWLQEQIGEDVEFYKTIFKSK